MIQNASVFVSSYGTVFQLVTTSVLERFSALTPSFSDINCIARRMTSSSSYSSPEIGSCQFSVYAAMADLLDFEEVDQGASGPTSVYGRIKSWLMQNTEQIPAELIRGNLVNFKV